MIILWLTQAQLFCDMCEFQGGLNFPTGQLVACPLMEEPAKKVRLFSIVPIGRDSPSPTVPFGAPSEIAANC
jgi:hypothetical protein